MANGTEDLPKGPDDQINPKDEKLLAVLRAEFDFLDPVPESVVALAKALIPFLEDLEQQGVRYLPTPINNALRHIARLADEAGYMRNEGKEG